MSYLDLSPFNTSENMNVKCLMYEHGFSVSWTPTMKSVRILYIPNSLRYFHDISTPEYCS